MTRVLQVCDFHPPQRGGLEEHVARLARQLSTRGHDVTVATVAGDATDDGVPVFELELDLARLRWLYRDATRPFHPPWPDHAFTAALDRLVTRHRPEVLHAHGWCAYSVAAVAHRRDVPLVVTLHDHGLVCPARTMACGHHRAGVAACLRCHATDQGRFRRGALAAALRRRLPVDPRWRFLAVSRSVARTATTALRRTHVEVVPNFVDLVDHRPSPTPVDGPVLFVGSGTAAKGRSVLEAAHARLLDAGRPVPLTLVGGPDPDGRARPYVEERGYLVGEPLWDAYRAAALVVVCPTVPDACPTVALEAMTFGRPLLATATGGLPDLVRCGATGVLVPPGDARALAAAIERLLAHPKVRVQMGEAARRRAVRFSAAAVVPRIEAIYAEVTR